MIDILLDRKWRTPRYSVGRFFINGKCLSNSMENPDRKLVSSMSDAFIQAAKKAGKTAIPLGTYKVTLTKSAKFKNKEWAKKYGGLVPLIVGVPGYTGVRIHPGNTVADTDGCPLVGDNKEVGRLCNSLKRYYELMDNYLMPAFQAGEEMEITIK